MDLRQADLEQVTQFLDSYFRVHELPTDPAFSRFVPMVYDPIEYPWRHSFEPGFVERFNGLMIRGRDTISQVWCISFPSDEVIRTILSEAQPGDLLFSHHPIDMRCGDPRGEKGEGFIPIDPELLGAMVDRGLSFYSCHIPLDTHTELSTSDAIVRAIGGTVTGQLLPAGNGYAGRLCEISPSGLDELVETCMTAAGLPYVEQAGVIEKEHVTRVAVIAGGAGDVAFYAEADRLGADCLIAGEVTSKIDNEIGTAKQREIEDYLPVTGLSAIGLSHAGSEFLVMKEMVPFIENHLQLPAQAIPESCWWR